MPLHPGNRLGPYELVAPLGAGGMGEVYRAKDSRLNRQVAIKVLPARFAADEDRLRRFQQEAGALAALNDPGILVVYDVGVQDGLSYLVSELLEGETLRERLRSGALSGRRSVEYGAQIARALAAAHEKGIIHRDLKPENIFVTREGRIKILDFGLAKLSLQEAGAGVGHTAAPTTAADNTNPGMMLGTVGYMSPEQIRGLRANERSDIFALGAVLYEMISGQRAFKGQTSADTISAILKEDPPELVQAGREISPALERIVRHCLEKSPEERFRSAHDVAFALENISQSSQTDAAVSSIPMGRQLSLQTPLFLIVGVLGLVAGAFLGWRGMHGNSLPTFRRLTFERGFIPSARFTADGRNAIYGASWESKPIQLFTTPLDSPLPRPLEVQSASLLGMSRSGEMALALDGKVTSHLVTRDATLASAPLAGGAPREILEEVRAADWAPDGTLAVVHQVDGRSRVEYPIGKVLYETGGWISHLRVSAKGDRMAFLLHATWSDDRGVVAMVDRDGNEKALTREWEAEEGLAWSAKGDEVWFTATSSGSDRALFAVSPSGTLRTLLRIPGGLTLHDIAQDGRVLLSFDDDKVGLVSAREGAAERDLTWLGWTVAEALSPDGNSVVFSEQAEPAGNGYTVAMRSIDGSVPKRLGEGNAFGFSRDGKWVAATPADLSPQITLLPTGVGQPRRIRVPGLQAVTRGFFFPDEQHLLVIGAERGHAFRAYVLDIATGKSTPITPEGVVAVALSPDGREVAARDLSENIVVYSLEMKAPRTIFNTNGMLPLEWSTDGGSLIVVIPDEIPARVLRINLSTGRQELLRRLGPSDLRGVYELWNFIGTPDGKTFAYSYRQTLSTLYLAEGLK